MTHTIAWTIDENLGILGKVRCDAPEGTNCRLICDSGCEEWSPAGHEHALVDGGFCLIAAHLNIDPEALAEMYAGNETELRNAAIVSTWDGDYFTWNYAPVDELVTTNPEGTAA